MFLWQNIGNGVNLSIGATWPPNKQPIPAFQKVGRSQGSSLWPTLGRSQGASRGVHRAGEEGLCAGDQRVGPSGSDPCTFICIRLYILMSFEAYRNVAKLDEGDCIAFNHLPPVATSCITVTHLSRARSNIGPTLFTWLESDLLTSPQGV